MDNQKVHLGGCLCGALSFEIRGDLPKPDACHCSMCRSWTGHFLVSSDVKRANLKLLSSETLCWFQSSQKVRRGFCSGCGSSLFFDPVDKEKHDWIGVALGGFKGATGTQIEKHIFTEDKSDYYQIDETS